MANQTGIAIMIKAFLPTGKTLNEQFEALSIVKTSHETGDYSALLKAATVEEVKTEQKTRRIEEQPQGGGQAGQTEGESQDQSKEEGSGEQPPAAANAEPETKPDPAADVPEFLKKDKKPKAA